MKVYLNFSLRKRFIIYEYNLFPVNKKFIVKFVVRNFDHESG